MHAHERQNSYNLVYTFTLLARTSFPLFGSETREDQSYPIPSTGGHEWCWKNLCFHCCWTGPFPSKCVCVCMCVCVHVRVCVCCACCVYVFVIVYVCLLLCMCVCYCVCVCMCVGACMWVCVFHKRRWYTWNNYKWWQLLTVTPGNLTCWKLSLSTHPILWFM